MKEYIIRKLKSLINQKNITDDQFKTIYKIVVDEVTKNKHEESFVTEVFSLINIIRENSLKQENKKIESTNISSNTTITKSITEKILSGKDVYVKFEQYQSPGDIFTLTPSIRDLKKKYPNIHIKLKTSCPAIWENNPYIEEFDDKLIDYQSRLEYNLVHKSNECGKHMSYGFKEDIEERLGVTFELTNFNAEVHLSDKEKSWINQFEDTFGKKEPFWIINAGSKNDFPLKQWPYERWQEVVNALKDRINFVQVGSAEHNHKPLEGVYNLLGKTDLRQLIRLAYHAVGGIGHVSMLSHLLSCWSKPSVVVAGSRETQTWESYNTTQYIHRIGSLDCCKHGGCWKSKPSQCSKMQGEFPKCMNIIESVDVIRAIEIFLEK